MLTFLGASTSVGKTAFAMNLVKNISHLQNTKWVQFYTTEMLMIELVERYCLMAGYNYKQFNQEQEKEVLDELDTRQIKIDDSYTLTIEDVKRKSRRLSKSLEDKGGLGLIVIDHLHIMTPNSKWNLQISEPFYKDATKQLKGLAKQLNVPILLLGQLNSEGDKNNDSNKEVKLYHVRDSRAITHNCNNVMFLNTTPEEENNVIKKYTLRIAKNRAGTRNSGIRFDYDTTKQIFTQGSPVKPEELETNSDGL